MSIGTSQFEDIANQSVNSDLVLPNYLPLHNDLTRDFEKALKFQSSIFNSIEDLIDQLINEIDNYVDYLLTNTRIDVNELYLNQNLKNLESLVESSFKLDVYKNSIESSKQKIKSLSLKEPDLTIETLSHYKSNEDNVNFGELIIAEYNENKELNQSQSSFQSVLKSNDGYQYLKNVSFILKYPEDPLPDESENDEIKVSGGKISLKDPLSLNYFKNPVISNKCSHTYEQSTIAAYLGEGNTNCPINGCNATLHKNDLKFDKIMLLRVKTYLALEKDKKVYDNVERLI